MRSQERTPCRLLDHGQRYFRRVGGLVLWYSHHEMDRRAAAVARVLIAAMKQLQSDPPSATTLPSWRSAVTSLFTRAGGAGNCRRAGLPLSTIAVDEGVTVGLTN